MNSSIAVPTPSFHRVQVETPDPQPAPPPNQQSLGGMQCVPVGDGSLLTFEPLNGDGTLVLASAFDKRQPCRLILRDPSGGWEYELDVGYGSIAQRYHVPIPAGLGALRVTALDEDAAFWVLADDVKLAESVPAVWPISDRVDRVDRVDRFFQRLENDCLAEFGWMGGCVLEAFDALAERGDGERWRAARDRWLGHFLDDRHLHYQDALGRPLSDTFRTIEATLPLASISRRTPDHPVIDLAVEYLLSQPEPDATCEGCYTVAYPLMQIAELRDRNDLRERAFLELQTRREKLFCEGDIYLRHHTTHRTFRNWTRGVAWYLLGNAECLHLAPREGPWEEVASHLAERAEWALRHQREDGLWNNFFDEPGPPPDTSGSAGIAAALIRTHELGLIGNEAVVAAHRCWSRLPDHLFVDGWIGGVAPSNKRGEEAQHGSRRVSETFGMGLVGRLAGAVHGTGG